jgi:hypothetical protein
LGILIRPLRAPNRGQRPDRRCLRPEYATISETSEGGAGRTILPRRRLTHEDLQSALAAGQNPNRKEKCKPDLPYRAKRALGLAATRTFET